MLAVAPVKEAGLAVEARSQYVLRGETASQLCALRRGCEPARVVQLSGVAAVEEIAVSVSADAAVAEAEPGAVAVAVWAECETVGELAALSRRSGAWSWPGCSPLLPLGQWPGLSGYRRPEEAWVRSS